MKNKLITLLLTVLFIISIGFLIYQQREIKSSLSEIQEQSELIEILGSEKENLISEEQELQDKLASLKNETETLESDITTLAEENKSLSKSIDQSKQNITQKEEEKAESTKEVAESNNVENQGNANGTINSDGSLNLDKLAEMGFGKHDLPASSGSASGLGDNSSGNWNDVTIY